MSRELAGRIFDPSSKQIPGAFLVFELFAIYHSRRQITSLAHVCRMFTLTLTRSRRVASLLVVLANVWLLNPAEINT